MKKIIIALLLICPLLTQAQNSAVAGFFEKYANTEGFTTVNITQKMFGLIAALELDDELDEMDDIISNLDGIKILVYENEDGKNFASKYYNEAENELPKNYFEELMTVKDGTQNVKFLVRETKKDIIDEFLMIVGDTEEFVLISMTGKISLDAISKISKSLDIDGLEHLEELDKGNK